MTDNEIVKALECCSEKDCIQCPAFDENIECGENTIKQAVDLIKRQQLTIEELEAKRIEDDELLQKRVSEAVNVVDKVNQRAIDLLEEIVEDKKAELKKAKAEIDRLQKLLDNGQKCEHEWLYMGDEYICPKCGEKRF